jgi:hypothetical protein
LTCDLKRKLAELSNKSLEIRPSEEWTLFQRAIGGDKSWFHLDYERDHVWAYATNDVPERANHQIRSEKLMLTVLWSTRGPFVVRWMKLGHRLNTTHFINEVTNELVTSLKALGKFPDKKRFRLHLDKARLHTSQDSVSDIDGQKFVGLPYPVIPSQRIGSE